MSDPKEHTHIDSVGTYVKILVALLIATGVTTAVAHLDLGPFNTIVALSIASAKMLLVALFFMHIRHSRSSQSWWWWAACYGWPSCCCSR